MPYPMHTSRQPACQTDGRLLAVLLLSLSLLPGCATDVQHHTTQPAAPVPQMAPTAAALLRQAIAPSLYQLAYVPGTPQGDAIYVASAYSGAADKAGGRLFVLDPATLAVRNTLELAREPYAVAFNPTTRKLYLGNSRSIDNAITVVDADTLEVEGEILLNSGELKSRNRRVQVDAASNRIFASGVMDDKLVWIIDGGDNTITQRIPDATRGPALLFEAETNRIYTGGSAEVRVIDATTQHVLKVFPLIDQPKRFIVNIASDPASKRLFITDAEGGHELLVLDADSGAILKTLPTGKGALEVKFNPVRNELYVTNRYGGTLNVIDATDYTVKHSVDLPTHPNSVVIDPSGQVLYVTIKEPFPEKGETPPDESVARITLR